jgi:hypothetical protein
MQWPKEAKRFEPAEGDDLISYPEVCQKMIELPGLKPQARRSDRCVRENTTVLRGHQLIRPAVEHQRRDANVVKSVERTPSKDSLDLGQVPHRSRERPSSDREILVDPGARIKLIQGAPLKVMDCTPKMRHEVKGRHTLDGDEVWTWPEACTAAS